MILIDIISPLHISPSRPAHNFVLTPSIIGPDPLAPDDILQFQLLAMMHHPFCNLAAADGGFLGEA